MVFFKKRKLLLILLIILCGIGIMWSKPLLQKYISSIPLESLKQKLFAKKTAGETLDISLGQFSEEAIPVKVAAVGKADYKDTITSFGTIKGFGEIPIKFKENGIVSKFNFKEGDSIKKNEIVVSQDQREEKLKLEYSTLEYAKNKKLYELGAITKDKLRQIELELETSDLEIKKRNFYAPSDGIMGTRKVSEGELAGPDDIVATFLDLNKVFCEIGIIEKDMGKVKEGQEVKVTLESFANEAFGGIVDSVSPMIEGRSRTQTVRILIPNEKNLIKPGMFARADITTFEKKDALVVPREALDKTEEGYVVFGAIKQNNPKTGSEEVVAKVMPVKVERATESLALISEGLAEGQEIIIESPRAKESIKDGSLIEIIKAE